MSPLFPSDHPSPAFPPFNSFHKDADLNGMKGSWFFCPSLSLSPFLGLSIHESEAVGPKRMVIPLNVIWVRQRNLSSLSSLDFYLQTWTILIPNFTHSITIKDIRHVKFIDGPQILELAYPVGKAYNVSMPYESFHLFNHFLPHNP